MIRGAETFVHGGAGARRLAVALLAAAVVVLLTGCSRRFLSVFLDLPEPPPEAPGAEAPPSPTTPSPALLLAPEDTARPEIESVLDPDSVRALLPSDAWGNVDWSKAVHEGIIRPRPALPDDEKPTEGPFAYDFVFPGPDSTQNAVFRHSVHAYWVSCAQCHERIYRVRGEPITMGPIFAGQSCAECHGSVVFPAMTCQRCHPALAMPSPTDKPVPFPPPMFLRRAGDTITLARDSVAEAPKLALSGLPKGRFPHQLHQVRYRCKACHLELFEPEAGAQTVTMADIAEGKACGRCHDGRAAFGVEAANCSRCHFEDARGPGP